jgi:hypothetical protein
MSSHFNNALKKKMGAPKKAYRMASQELLDTPRPRAALLEVRKAPQKANYKIPATPDVSGIGWK